MSLFAYHDRAHLSIYLLLLADPCTNSRVVKALKRNTVVYNAGAKLSKRCGYTWRKIVGPARGWVATKFLKSYRKCRRSSIIVGDELARLLSGGDESVGETTASTLVPILLVLGLAAIACLSASVVIFVRRRRLIAMSEARELETPVRRSRRGSVRASLRAGNNLKL